ncbi:MAG: SRPBCC family protein [bacterium]|nr:SRPBCC family protein [bacterium]
MGKTYQSIVIDAPADKVWSSIKDFHDLSWAPNVIEKVEVVGGQKGDQVGAKRVLNDAFHETLHAVNNLERSIQYTIDDGPPPVSKSVVQNYVGVVQVHSVTEGEASFVAWSSSWEGNDGPTCDFCHPIYVALLTDMKKSLEG